ncbi:hypothetical protein [uncultured Paludibaculum sp.]|uniref:hypothetical protein n=1 Tax=uncultured Paludibaculum sp. TaxID=1765020 RepID=UPI002AAC1A90|nr:hypothetical protein [uncultured Paludibaculum sp.]
MDRRSTHLSEEDLSLIQDGAPPAGASAHLEACADCRQRLSDLEAGLAAYAQFLDEAVQPDATPAPKPWASLDALLQQHESEAESKWKFWRPWPAVAIAAGLLAVLGLTTLWTRRGADPLPAEEVLARSSGFQPVEGSLLSVRFEGKTVVRPAVSPGDSGENMDMMRLQRAFAAAHYDWTDPLSARSFLAWRRTLQEKQDAVSVVGTGAGRAYRVRTSTSAGSLRAASLTVTAVDWRPSEADFEFERIGIVALSNAPAPLQKFRKEPRSAGPLVETPAGPEDTLRVLAVLHQLGADVDDPITISEDARKTHVVVSGRGLTAERQRQIAEALSDVPRAAVRFGAREEREVPATARRSEKYAAKLPDAFRRRLEERLGGMIPLQEATDRLLDAGADLLARAHAINLLAEKFPSGTEQQLGAGDRRTLRTLRTDHARQMENSLDTIEPDLRRLLADGFPRMAQPVGSGSWQADTPALLGAAQESSALLNRLLAGRYTEQEGEEMLRQLAAQTARLRVGITALRERSE